MQEECQYRSAAAALSIYRCWRTRTTAYAVHVHTVNFHQQIFSQCQMELAWRKPFYDCFYNSRIYRTALAGCRCG